MIDFNLLCTWKNKFLGTYLEGILRTPCDRIFHSIYIVRTFCCQLPAREIWGFLPSTWSCLLILWLEICVLNDKFCFPGIVKVKLPVKFYLYSFEWFCLQLSDTKCFSSPVQGIGIEDLQLLLFVIFKSETKKNTI